jgi:DNA repair exonuclease SbcCD nuclease subunit
MNFTFLHAADLHLGSPLTGLAQKDELLAKRLALASREAFSELVARAISERVAFVLIAGDVYDGDWKDTSIGLFFNREVAKLSRAGIPVFLVRGNHDAESEITKSVPLPDGVIEFSSRKAETKCLSNLQVAIHGQSFADRAATENIAVNYPMPLSGWLNIGLLHTSCEGHTEHAVYACPCRKPNTTGEEQ